MIDAITYEDMLKHILENELIEDTVGILFTRPDLCTGKDILESLNYYHHLTGGKINFYLPGYGAYWNGSDYPDRNTVTCIDGVDWLFSCKAFVDFVNDLEDVSKWEYSGESELLLISYHDKILDFSKTIVFYLDEMLRDETISSVSSFVTELNRRVKRNNSIMSISTFGASRRVSKEIVEEIIESMPKFISNPLCKGKHYLHRDFSL
ncbi:MAG: hypothetical protein E7613_09110 [Ruminococcaceae bacterium]|nr:hypothetical protein [Oscillospiraceae bacterium]